MEGEEKNIVAVIMAKIRGAVDQLTMPTQVTQGEDRVVRIRPTAEEQAADTVALRTIETMVELMALVKFTDIKQVIQSITSLMRCCTRIPRTTTQRTSARIKLNSLIDLLSEDPELMVSHSSIAHVIVLGLLEHKCSVLESSIAHHANIGRAHPQVNEDIYGQSIDELLEVLTLLELSEPQLDQLLGMLEKLSTKFKHVRVPTETDSDLKISFIETKIMPAHAKLMVQRYGTLPQNTL